MQTSTSGYAPAAEDEGGSTANGDPVAGPAYGVQITQLYEGTAADQGLMVGDTILSYNGTPTPNYEALCAAVQQSGGQVEVVFLNSQNNQTESMILYPQNGRIGMSGQTVQLP